MGPDADYLRQLEARIRLLEAENRALRVASLASNNADMLSYVVGKAPVTPAMAGGAIQWMVRAMRLNPLHPDYYWSSLGIVLFTLGRYAEAADAYHQAPDFLFYALQKS